MFNQWMDCGQVCTLRKNIPKDITMPSVADFLIYQELVLLWQDQATPL